MNKVKKLAAVLVCALMVCVFATSAFADAQSEAAGYLQGKGISLSGQLTAAQAEALAENKDYLVSQGDALYAYGLQSVANAQTNAQTAVNIIQSTGAFPDLRANVTVDGNKVRVVATAAGANGTTLTASGDILTGSSSNVLTSSSSSVIKATGDNAAVVLVAFVLAIVGILGLAVRKNSASSAI